jgi:hypothetical protein
MGCICSISRRGVDEIRPESGTGIPGTRDPFAGGEQGSIPVGLIPDAVLRDVDAFGVVCLGADDLGTSEPWYRFLNLGIPIAENAGSDVMTDFLPHHGHREQSGIRPDGRRG